MKVAVVYNRESKNVVNLFGMPNKEKIGRKTIDRLVNALKEGGHQVVALEGDKDLVDRLEEFMPRVIKGERPGMVFNVSYGIQGQARYTHVPSILEMIGVPYVGSGPLAHSLSLDKVVTKMILRQHGLPTPDFAVLQSPDDPLPELTWPLIVKPKNEAVSFGLKVVQDEAELRDAARVIFDEYGQAVLVEQYIEGREVNVGLLGNSPPHAFPPVELSFGDEGPRVYTYEDKTGRSGRTIQPVCPAPIGDELTETAQRLAVGAFTALGCYDCARVDMRLDENGKLYILETNSLPSLGEHGSYLVGAAHVGMDFTKFVNQLIEVASARYFGTAEPRAVDPAGVEPTSEVFGTITQRRDALEKRLQEWTNLSSRTSDPVGIQEAARRADRVFSDMRMSPVEELGDGRTTWAWETATGFEGGTLFVGHLDVPAGRSVPHQQFRREPEWLFGDGIGSSRASLVMLEFALRAVRRTRKLRKMPVGVLLYADEGRDAQESAAAIRKAAKQAKRVLVLRPGNVGDTVITRRRGHRRFRLRVTGEPRRIGRPARKPDALRWTWNQLERLCQLSSQDKRVSVSALGVETEQLPMRLPHRIVATLLMTYPDERVGDALEEKMRKTIAKGGPRWDLEVVSDRPAMTERRGSVTLARRIGEVAEEWDVPFKRESSVQASVAGLVPGGVPRVCGLGPVARDLGLPTESVLRIGLVQRTLLLAQFLLKAGDDG